MEYWEGGMNWPLNKDWKCQTCEEYRGLTWGLVHGECRCNNCHTHYTMYDINREMVNVPICLLKEEYKEYARKGWQIYHKPISKWSDDEWGEAGAKI